MTLAALLLVAQAASVSPPILQLELVRSVTDVERFELRDPVTGDRGVPRSCAIDAQTTVSLQSTQSAKLEVNREGSKRLIVIDDVRGLGRPTLACGNDGRFFYANPRRGILYAYSADRLLQGADPVLWTRTVAPFVSMDDAANVMTNASVATVVQARGNLVLVEWLYRKDGTTSFWHQVFDQASGAELGKLGPSDLLIKTNESDPWWIAFQGGGNEIVNYVPKAIFRLKWGVPAATAVSAADAIAALHAPAELGERSSKLSTDPVVNHMIALLTPTRTSATPTIEFCPSVPAERARYWLGAGYDQAAGAIARDKLMLFWIENTKSDPGSNPIDRWFRTEIAPKEPMASVLAKFNPRDDAWISRYQQALLELGGPTLRRLSGGPGAGSP